MHMHYFQNVLIVRKGRVGNLQVNDQNVMVDFFALFLGWKYDGFISVKPNLFDVPR